MQAEEEHLKSVQCKGNTCYVAWLVGGGKATLGERMVRGIPGSGIIGEDMIAVQKQNRGKI